MLDMLDALRDMLCQAFQRAQGVRKTVAAGLQHADMSCRALGPAPHTHSCAARYAAVTAALMGLRSPHCCSCSCTHHTRFASWLPFPVCPDAEGEICGIPGHWTAAMLHLQMVCMMLVHVTVTHLAC